MINKDGLRGALKSTKEAVKHIDMADLLMLLADVKEDSEYVTTARKEIRKVQVKLEIIGTLINCELEK